MNLRNAFLVVLLSTPAVAQVNASPTVFFPRGAFYPFHHSDDFVNAWFSAELVALQEPSLYPLAKVPSSYSYRFLWLRTFAPAIAIRLEIQSDGTSNLTTKTGTGESGFNITRLALASARSETISVERTNTFLQHIAQKRFWTLPTTAQTRGCDGSEWVIEGVRAGKYHVVRRSTPRGGPVYEVGKELAFDLSKLAISPKDVY